LRSCKRPWKPQQASRCCRERKQSRRGSGR